MSLAGNPARSRLAGGAYWAMMSRIVVMAACIDASWIGMYALIGSPVLAWLNVISVAMYAAALAAIRNRRNTLAIVLIWTEVLCHAALGSILIGWESGFHYFLLLFIPAIVIGSDRRKGARMVIALFLFYAGLQWLCADLGALTPLRPWPLRIASWVNLVLIFGLFYTMAAFYRETVIVAESRLLKAATTDPLTGLANRSQFHVRALTEMSHSRRSNIPVSLVLADVDFFKRINDTHGHDAGDKVLVRLAGLLRTSLRDVDVLARWGGEEFLALLPASDIESATEVAERLRKAVAAAHIDIGGQVVQVTMSFGISQILCTDDLLPATARADRALYESKRDGRNRVTALAPIANDDADVAPGIAAIAAIAASGAAAAPAPVAAAAAAIG